MRLPPQKKQTKKTKLKTGGTVGYRRNPGEQRSSRSKRPVGTWLTRAAATLGRSFRSSKEAPESTSLGRVDGKGPSGQLLHWLLLKALYKDNFMASFYFSEAFP